MGKTKKLYHPDSYNKKYSFYQILHFLENSKKKYFKTSIITLFIIASFIFNSQCSAPSRDYRDNVFELTFTSGEAEKNVARLIDDARFSIYVALYGFNNEVIAESVVKAHRRGVEIKMVTEYDSEHEESWQKIIEHKIPLVLTNASGIMHNKYFIIDMTYVVTGSTNLTSGMLIHFNNMMIIKCPALARDFKMDFDVLYNGYSASSKDAGLTAVHGITEWPENEHFIGSYFIRVFFTPYRKSFPSYGYYSNGIDYTFYNYDDAETQSVNYKSALNIIIPLLQQARFQIYVLTFAFTDRVIAHEMMEAFRRGADVRLWMDYNMYASQFTHSGKTYNALRDTLGPERARIVRQADGGLLHHKVLIIDDTLILGSLNFSNSAVTKNDENFIVIRNALPLIGLFKQEAARIDQESHPIPY